MYIIIHNFFTIWIFVLVIFHNISSKFFSLPYLSFVILFNGLYISYINPCKYYIQYYDDNNEKSIIVIEGIKKYMVDIIFHIMPFIFIYLNYGIEPFFNNLKIIPSLLLIFLYILLYNPCVVYRIKINEITFLSISGVILYNFIYFFYK